MPWRVTDAEWSASLSAVPSILNNVAPAYRDRCERVLRGMNEPGFSQAWQDWILYRNFFAGQRTGVYVEVGTNDAIKLSNTAFFDLCLGWRGICFEPQEMYHAKIREKRRCELVPSCVLGQPGNSSFRGTGTHMSAGGHVGKQSTMTCVGLLQELQRLRIGTSVDLLSIDIEGLEPNVLRCVPWHELNIRLVLIETNKHRLSMVDNFFHAHGYANVATLLQGPHPKDRTATWLDNLYLRMPGGPLVVPRGEPTCSHEDRQLNTFCAPFARWERGTVPWQCTR